MSRVRILLKLSFLPIRRSWMLVGFLWVSLAQILLALWLSGGIGSELARTEAYADRSRFVTIQLRDESVLVDPIKEVLEGDDVAIEELKSGQVIERLEAEEPEIVQTIQSVGGEGLGLVPRMILARGPIPDAALEKIKMMTEVSKVESSPVHHARLRKFYQHLGFEMRIALVLIVFLTAVQILLCHRILGRDSREVSRNLSSWGASTLDSLSPGFGSLLIVTQGAFALSLLEWWAFRTWIWKGNSFLGELSVDGTLDFPVTLCLVTAAVMWVLSGALAFSRRPEEE
jgi:hypothetical protein